ncbi:STAS domain-containing protein [Streptomyces sp. NBC_00178]|uniref:STAS domain-containing protein n=1 Tax=Streptomyces sp. NBC_00178 TaxID=2975672 RepID=UPI002E2A7BFB|nr:STAS domain-containing protein [Streptomyces sp. NBC_00178]
MTGDEKRVVVETAPDGAVLIRVRGSLDGWAGSTELADALTRAADGGTNRTVVDLSGVEFADSAGLHTLLDGRRQHGEAGIPLVLAGPMPAAVRRLLEVTGTLGAFQVADSVDSAFAW